MEVKMCLCQNLIWVMLLLGQLHGYESCVEKEKNGLLELKNYLISQSIEGEANSVLPTWSNDTKSECCLWEGLKCSGTSGLVTEIAFGGLKLKEKTLLNLSLLHPFEDVQSLNLSSNQYSGLFDDVEGYNSLRKLTNLEILDLTSNKFNNTIFPFLNAATSLKTLFLRSNNMGGSLPVKEFRNLTNLELLDLSRNRFNGSIPLQELSDMRNLKALDLSRNEFSASTELKGICELRNIQELDLSNNKLVGQFPLCLTSLSGLRVLDLSSNQFTGKLPPSLGSLTSLEYLSLFDNNFNGFFSLGSLTNLTNLRVLKLCSKSNSLQLASDSSWKPKFQLDVIALRSCNLDKTPQFLLHQKELRHVDLSDNNISGNFPSWLLENNTKLKVLLLQKNSFTTFQLPKTPHHLLFMDLSVNKLNHLLPVNIGWILPHLRYMNISNNAFRETLPSSLCNMKNIEYMDLSRNSFHGELPRGFLNGCDSMAILKLSHNKLTGEIFQEPPKFTNILGIFMDNNLFTGKIGQGLQRLRKLSLLDISNNNLTGLVPSWIGQLPSLTALLIANNLLEGNIPTSLFNNTNLQLLDLSTNSFSGEIPPQHKSKNGVVLLLQDNDLSGEISNTQLANVEILDLRNNRLSGSIPEFIRTQNISVLLLRGNGLTGLIPHHLCGLVNIQLLDISRNRLNGSIPSCLSNTSFVTGKRCTSYDYDFGISFPSDVFVTGKRCTSSSCYNSLKRLKNLEILDLSVNDFDNSIFPFLNAATSLTDLNLKDNSMDGPFPIKALRNLTSLQLLNLSGNRFNGSMTTGEFPHLKKLKSLYLSGNGFSSSPELQGLKNLTNLEILDLSTNLIDETVPREVVCELKNLRELNLKWNFLEGQLPLCFGSLHKLLVLDLSYNQFSGNIPASFSNLKSLRYLSLSDNHFKGFFSFNPLTNLTKLKVLKLSSTSNMLQIETKSTWQPKFQLSVAALPSCSMEKIPDFLIYQKSLRLVDLSNNRLSGHIPTWLLENNPELKVLLLQNNSFTIFQAPTLLVHKLQVLDFSANDIISVLPRNIGHTLPNLIHMNGSDNTLQGNLPSSIGEMKNISFLDLSHNNLSGELPPSFLTGCSSLLNLKLSHNKFTGHFLPTETNLTSLNTLKMDNNLLTGKIGVGLLSLVVLTILDISNNSLTGSVPSWTHNSSLRLTMVVLSNNLLEGVLPPSLLAIQQLSFLDLSGNLLSGELPSSNVTSRYGIILFLQNNSFTGPIPSTLLEKATVVDLRNNKLSGSIPQFVNTMALRILLLRGNDLTGTIPRKLCDLSSVRILDLSDNKLSGFIPSCLYNLSTTVEEEIMMSSYSMVIHVGDSYFRLEMFKSTLLVEEYSVDYATYLSVEIEFASKQRYDSYSGSSQFIGSSLDYMYGLDLSSNELSGAIPAELGDLSKLRAMNLSRNFLSSSIPDSFSKLKDIESLDLSYNMLHGNIPHQLTNLTSLAVFNVSYNNLSGIIPQGVQFHTFKDDSYLGNPFLCGPPTDISCKVKSSEEGDKGGEEEDDEAVVDMMVFYWSITSTYVVALIGIILLMCFDCSWSRAWIHLVDAFIASAKRLFP